MKLSVCKPLLPTAEKLLPYFKEIDNNRYYSNKGPLNLRFEEKLSNHFNVPKENISTAANGTLALIQMLKAHDVIPNSLCVMPSWTFTATPSAAIWAGLSPFFVDVNEQHWCIQPHHVFPLLKENKIGAVIVVAPFGHLKYLDEWKNFNQETKIPVILDAAAAFDSINKFNKNENKISLPTMVSLHATKVFGVGEGAAIISPNHEHSKKIKMLGNFGFHDSRESLLAGSNTKMDEFTSAVGLAAYSEWPEKKEKWLKLSKIFYSWLKKNPTLESPPGADQDWASCYGQVLLPKETNIEFIQNQLAKVNIPTIRWWGNGCHQSHAYKNFRRSDLTITEKIAKRTLGLPFYIDMPDDSISYIFANLMNVLDQNKSRSTNNG